MGRPAIDLTSKVFGELTVIQRLPSLPGEPIKWVCKCSCGRKTIVSAGNLTNKNRGTKSCGKCEYRYKASAEATTKPINKGTRCGKVIVIEPTPQRSYNRSVMYRCKCDCGDECLISAIALRKGNCSCGKCGYKSAQTRLANEKYIGDTEKHLAIEFNLIKQRCQNPRATGFSNYGGRGIHVCKEWNDNTRSFIDWAIANGYNENLTIDRIKVNGPYSPDNCRWVDRHTQANNKSNNVYITTSYDSRTIADWARDLGFSYSFLYKTLYRDGHDAAAELIDLAIQEKHNECESRCSEEATSAEAW